jgi:molybdopterin/thiamine biosynthesis adenylyltransferase
MDHFFEKQLNNRGVEFVDNMVCNPNFFRLHDEISKQEFKAFLKENPSVQTSDEIYSQLSELIKLKFPKKKFSSDELKEAIIDHTGGIDLVEYGEWVYYPWLNKVIHILPKDEFVEVRTNRNQYKITPKEEEFLSNKKIGIIGLSVGKSIALTIALERICGELVLADFDVIELSNLNRIQTGIQNLGLKKTVIVAREIAEIDPYLEVKCIHDGLTEENVNEFFTKGKKLDICIEVCDGLYTKIFARQKAKELGVPVVMNSSDRGTTDVERFDLDPELPILHGLIDHLDLSKVKQAKTNEEKVPYLLPMLGVGTSSDRLKASMLEIEETITTWPQLASGVVFGGGICTDVCRRILLGQFTKSGRYFVLFPKSAYLLPDNIFLFVVILSGKITALSRSFE